MSDIGWNVDRLDCVEGRLRTQVLSVRAIQLVERWCANGGPNRGTLLEAGHRLVERPHAGTRRPFADIRQRGSVPLWSPATSANVQASIPPALVLKRHTPLDS